MKHRSSPSPSGLLATLALAAAAACAQDPTRPPLPAFESLEIVAPSSVLTGQAFPISVTALDGSGAVASDYSGTATLEVSAGTIVPASVTLTAGAATADVTLSGATGALTFTVRAESRSADTDIDQVLMGSLEGGPTQAATTIIPSLRYVPDPTGFATDHPDLPGLELSFNQVVVSLEPGATVQQVNDALAAVGAAIVGGFGGPAGTAGILMLRLPASSHAAAAPLLMTLEAAPGIARVAPDVMLEPTLTTRSNAGAPAPQPNWTWDLVPQGGNWGMEYVRAPQIWNLVSGILKAGAPDVRTTVLDNGFTQAHPDMLFMEMQSLNARDHGMHVSGTIGASFDNGEGVDGINPFARIRAIQMKSWAWMLTTLPMEAANGARVINTSLGYNWYQKVPPINPNSTYTAQSQAINHGEILGEALETLSASGMPTFLMVTAAGNDSNPGQPSILAQWGSPMANAAIFWGAPDILVVEAVARPAGGAPAQRVWFSNVGGTISAPGDSIRSLGDSVPYLSLSGTSMATPHVAGLVGFLLELAPELTNDQLRQILPAPPNRPGAGARRP